MPPAFEQITWKTYILFVVFCISMFIHVFFLFPETANKPLEEVEEIFNDKLPGAIKYIGQPAWKTRNTRSLVLQRERNEIVSDEKLANTEGDHREGALGVLRSQPPQNSPFVSRRRSPRLGLGWYSSAVKSLGAAGLSRMNEHIAFLIEPYLPRLASH